MCPFAQCDRRTRAITAPSDDRDRVEADAHIDFRRDSQSLVSATNDVKVRFPSGTFTGVRATVVPSRLWCVEVAITVFCPRHGKEF